MGGCFQRSSSVTTHPNPPDPLVNFLLGICKFLQGGKENTELGMKYIGLVSKSRDWFRELPDQKAIFSKLMLYTKTANDTDAPDPLEDPDTRSGRLSFCIVKLARARHRHPS